MFKLLGSQLWPACWFERWHFCDKQQRNSLCLGTVPKYPRQTAKLQPIPTTGRASVGSPDHSSLEDVQRGQHYQCQITSCSQSDCCAKFKLRGQPEKYKLPFRCWYQCQHGRCGTPKWRCVPHSGVHRQQTHIYQHSPCCTWMRQKSSNCHR